MLFPEEDEVVRGTVGDEQFAGLEEYGLALADGAYLFAPYTGALSILEEEETVTFGADNRFLAPNEGHHTGLALNHGISNLATDETNSPDGIIISRNRIVYLVRVTISIHYCFHWYSHALSLSYGNLFF